MFFSWLRRKARDAILAGAHDALAELDAEGATDHDDTTARLLARLADLGKPGHAYQSGPVPEQDWTTETR